MKIAEYLNKRDHGNDYKYWIGLHNRKWTDGSPTKYTNWAKNEPNGEKCGLIYNGDERKWHGAKCHHHYRYICKKSVATKDFSVRLIVPELTPVVVIPEPVKEETPVVVMPEPVKEETPVEVMPEPIKEKELKEVEFSLDKPLVTDVDFWEETKNNKTLTGVELYTQHKIDMLNL